MGHFKRSAALLVSTLLVFTASACLPVRQASADMVEVKGNIMNGEVVSDDGKKIEFRDAKGDVRVLDKKDVTYMQIDKKDTGKPKPVTFTDTLSGVLTSVFGVVRKAPEALKSVTDGTTQRFTDTVGKPLQRSQVQAGAIQSTESAPLKRETLTLSEEMEKKRLEVADADPKNYNNRRRGKDDYDAQKGRFGTL